MVLAVPNWSFGRNRALAIQVEELLHQTPVTVHFCAGDVDHNRTVTAFSGDRMAVLEAIQVLARLIIPAIDLNRHMGVHPRIGALDVCPVIPLTRDENLESLLSDVESLGATLAQEFDLPVFLYEKSERGRHEADLPTLRKGGFGGLLGRELHPDFGPNHAHPEAGATVLGVREFLVALNMNFQGELGRVKEIARALRHARQEGDERVLGLRALGLPLQSRQQVQVSMNLTLPNLTPIDPILEDLMLRGQKLGLQTVGPELIGVIRPRDLEGATRLPFAEAQVVDSEF